ncbi:MAG: T9SS type A sorting domain-containing protein [Bacteroidetes bacterium]|nr:T9SS type A sorting domain-containing protein [Bacteroidota bacterium]
MKKLFTLTSAILFSIALFSQATLAPTIGVSVLPPDNSSVCTPACSGSYNFDTDGYLVGTLIPDFTLYTISGTPYNAQTLINTGKPLCIVAGSYTCPVWRGKTDSLNMLFSKYGSKVNFLVVYVCEAHPKSPDVSPYSCNVWDPNPNTIKYLQETTYGQRKATATDMVNNTCACYTPANPSIPMVIDGPCNEFWTHFGPAPNNAYLINPADGKVYCKHGWFDKAPNEMAPCIDQLLAVLTSVNEPNVSSTISVYPNPSADGRFTVSGLRSAVSGLEIYNVFGEKVFASTIQPSNNSTIQVSLPSGTGHGIYFYKLSDENGTVSSGKIIIE